MDDLNFGDIVLLKFSFTDGNTFKRRPALIINDCKDGDIIVCRITSRLYNSKYDIYVDNWATSGLKVPSIVRVHKIATLEKNMVEMIIGKIDEASKVNIRNIISNLAD